MAAAALGHPNIVGVMEFQANPGEPAFLVMEFLEGESLRTALKRDGPMGARRAARIARQVLSALAVAHKAQIVHRDIKPDNIFLVTGSALTDFVKVLDFGVAKLLDQGDARPLTREGMLLGTLNYMAPEQARGGAVDGRADIYAIAACLFHATAGRKAIEAENDSDLLKAILDRPPLELASIRPDIDPVFAAIVDRGLKKNPAERFETADQMERALGHWLDAPEEIPGTKPEASLAVPPEPQPVHAPVPAPVHAPAEIPQHLLPANARATVIVAPRAGARGGTVPMRAAPAAPAGAAAAPVPQVTAQMPAVPQPIVRARPVAATVAQVAVTPPLLASERQVLPPTLRSMESRASLAAPPAPRKSLAVVLVVFAALALVTLGVLAYLFYSVPG